MSIKFQLPIRYQKGADNLADADVVAGSIIDGGKDEWHLARIWNDGIDNADEFAALVVTAVNAHSALTEAVTEAIRLLDDDVDNALDAMIILRAALTESGEQKGAA